MDSRQARPKLEVYSGEAGSSKDAPGPEDRCSRRTFRPFPGDETTPSPAFITKNIEVFRTMIKEHDQQGQARATPKKLTYGDSEREGLGSPRTRNSSRIKTPSKLRRSERLEDRGRRGPNLRREGPSHGQKGQNLRKLAQILAMREIQKIRVKDLSTPYKRLKPTPFTSRITRFRHHRRAKLPQNVKVYEGSKDPEDHLDIFSLAAEQQE
ncbi:hypothetical protein Tco_0133396 [Tanacetum coccineum]